LFSNDLARIAAVGAGQYTLMLDDDGGIVADLIVFHSGDLEYLLVGNAEIRESAFEWMASHAPEGVALVHETQAQRAPDAGLVELVDESDRTALVSLQGPMAHSIVTELAGTQWRAPERFHVTEAMLDTVPTLVSRTGYTGEDGFEILTHVSLASRLWRVLLSFAEVTPAGLEARETLRLEMGYQRYGREIGVDVDPFSAGLSWAVALEKGDFIGREALAAIRERGPERRLVGLTLGEGTPQQGDAVLRGAAQLGKVASGTYSPTLGHPIATALLPAEFAAPGTELAIATRTKTVVATVEELPFVKGTSLPG
ncbi:MAG: glycine cleavage system aminomethyltransferase GcvT, partial [Coriobacteriales bacterium]|nr:glycine cleavage system aminomethyltransferase GcvT [Coriobacteriales bacterium]